MKLTIILRYVVLSNLKYYAFVNFSIYPLKSVRNDVCYYINVALRCRIREATCNSRKNTDYRKSYKNVNALDSVKRLTLFCTAILSAMRIFLPVQFNFRGVGHICIKK